MKTCLFDAMAPRTFGWGLLLNKKKIKKKSMGFFFQCFIRGIPGGVTKTNKFQYNVFC